MSSSVETKQDSKEPEGEGNLTISEGFQVNLLDLINLYISIVERITSLGLKPPCSTTMLKIAYDFVKSRNSHQLITGFITDSFEGWSLCLADENGQRSDKSLFQAVGSLLSGIPEEHLNTVTATFKVKDKNGVLVVTDEDKESVWEFIIEFIRMSIIYVHEQRCWKIRESGKKGYSKVFFKPLSIKKFSKMFGVELTY